MKKLLVLVVVGLLALTGLTGCAAKTYKFGTGSSTTVSGRAATADAAGRVQHARLGLALRALRTPLPRALSHRRRTARDCLATHCHQGQAGFAHQGDLAAGHLRKARAPGRAHEAQGGPQPGH